MAYVYLPLTTDEIRLLTVEPTTDPNDYDTPVRCSIHHVRLDSTPPVQPSIGHDHTWPEINTPCIFASIFTKHHGLPWRYPWGDFIALSYAWGVSKQKRSITLDGRPFPVTQNLFDALLHLRTTQRADVAERSAQVVRMRDIYSAAWQVAVWLGPEADDSGLAFTALRWMAARQRSPAPLEGLYKPAVYDVRPLFVAYRSSRLPLRPETRRALFRVLLRDYWQRMWILQEIALARSDAPVMCGRDCLSWADIRDSAVFIANDSLRLGRDIVETSRLNIWHHSLHFARDRMVKDRDRDRASERTWGLLIEIANLQRVQRETAPTQGEFEIFGPLRMMRNAKLTDEKDRVYGILGIRAVADRIVLSPDYERPLEDIYRDFTAQLISRGDLNPMRLISRYAGEIHDSWSVGTLIPSRKPISVGMHCTHDIPSWTICWTCKPPPTAPFRGAYRAAGAAIDPSCTVSLSANLDLTVRGASFDIISSLSSFHPLETDRSYPANATVPSCDAYDGVDGARDALWRTLVGNASTKDDSTRSPEAYSWLLQRQLWQQGVTMVNTNGFGFYEFMARNKDLVVCGHRLKELVFGPNGRRGTFKVLDDRVWQASQEQSDMLSLAMDTMAWRRLVGTAGGRMGLVPAAARMGDSIALLVGCETPMVLRKVNQRYQVIGECYVHGVMEGELLRDVKTLNLQDITTKRY
ncbi:hypothetical protein CONLIGDRAFT_658404 [Coniochaeta ligniaria NRRL 30616]|uniref:Heterokaryon incompatibility domain-containing protein n=1 Tax=Coniochaeta ligniaria NRRL 30616 TaxID=1408157 RepID=A0A1J7JWQ0_9PEZI|nr:hypothetical protein CONLIGDRAFT_658404 [Coniochaeta ligniaria NRRL 30616]